MEATEIAIVFVDPDLKIMRFTGKAERIFNFIQSDVGRPLSDVSSKLKYQDLTGDIKTTLKELTNIEKVVATEGGKWYNMSIKPNLSSNNKIEGAVLTFVDVTELKEAEEKLEEKIEIQKKLQQDVLRVEKKSAGVSGSFCTMS
ncbi:MAG: PAS domain-containing protein [Fodinibius sp.]|nr:PAS domain-containing protein [Fodinibius sp.]